MGAMSIEGAKQKKVREPAGSDRTGGNLRRIDKAGMLYRWVYGQ